MLSVMHKLRTLEVTKSPTLDDSVLKTVAENCACIRVLNINRTNISDEGLKHLADNSITLVALDISYTNVCTSQFWKV